MSPLPSRCGWRMRSDPASDPRMRSAFSLPPNTKAKLRAKRVSLSALFGLLGQRAQDTSS